MQIVGLFVFWNCLNDRFHILHHYVELFPKNHNMKRADPNTLTNREHHFFFHKNILLFSISNFIRVTLGNIISVFFTMIE